MTMTTRRTLPVSVRGRLAPFLAGILFLVLGAAASSGPLGKQEKTALKPLLDALKPEKTCMICNTTGESLVLKTTKCPRIGVDNQRCPFDNYEACTKCREGTFYSKPKCWQCYVIAQVQSRFHVELRKSFELLNEANQVASMVSQPTDTTVVGTEGESDGSAIEAEITPKMDLRSLKNKQKQTKQSNFWEAIMSSMTEGSTFNRGKALERSAFLAWFYSYKHKFSEWNKSVEASPNDSHEEDELCIQLLKNFNEAAAKLDKKVKFADFKKYLEPQKDCKWQKGVRKLLRFLDTQKDNLTRRRRLVSRLQNLPN